ncbi:MAG: MerR family DNA-binding transcriptional regulator, partial [bacterium]
MTTNNLLENQKQPLPISEAAKYLKVSIDTLRRWDKSGKLPSVRLNGQTRYFHLNDLNKVKSNSLLTISEASDLLNISPSTLRRLEEKALLNPQRGKRDQRLYRKTNLDNFANSDYFQERYNPQPLGPSPVETQPQVAPIKEKSPMESFLVKEPRSAPLKEHVSFAPAFAFYTLLICLIGITASFMLSPEKTAQFFGYRTGAPVAQTQQVLGAKYPKEEPVKENTIVSAIGRALKPLGDLALVFLSWVDRDTYLTIIKHENIPALADVSSVDDHGNLVTKEDLKLTVSNLSAQYLQGRVPGSSAGNIVVFDEAGYIEALIVGGANLLGDAVDSTKILGGGVNSDDIANFAITTDKIAYEVVTTQKLGNSSVTSVKIDDNTITTTDLSPTLLFANGDLLDLSAVDHTSVGKQGLLLPNVLGGSIVNPTSGEGYIAYDTLLNQIQIFDGSSWINTHSGDIDLGTDTTGNYVATIADAGNNTIIVVGSGMETAAVTLDIVADSLDFSHLSDSPTLDANTAINLDSNNLTFYGTGNVGVGTTAPAGKLHVVGECVAEGTLIKRRRKNKDGKWEEEDIPVEDIKQGDEVLSLNDKTGKFAWQKVEKTMGKGKQEVFALTTASGKRILTTANHPYFTLDKPLITHGTFEVDLANRVETFTKPTIIGVALGEFKYTVKLDQATKKAIKKTYQKQNKPDLFAPQTYAHSIVAAFKAAKIYPGEILIDTDYTGHNQAIRDIVKGAFPETEVNFAGVGKRSPAHFAAYGVHLGKREVDSILTAEFETKRNGQGHKALRALSHRDQSSMVRRPHDHILSESYYTDRDLSRAKWVKVGGIKEGQYVATVDGFEKVTGIQKLKKLQTYDLQIAGTRNFVANGIVAHNTYISGNVGVGTTNPLALLSLGTAGATAGTLNLAGGTAGTLTLDVPATVTSWTMTLPSADGNANEVMITDASGNLSFTTLGAASITADSLDYSEFVDAMTLDASTKVNLNSNNFSFYGTGNVGIGTTAPAYTLDVAGSFHATRTVTSYDNVITVDRNSGGDYTTIATAVAAINTLGDASAANPYVIWVMAGTYDEDVTLPDYVSLKGQGWRQTQIDGRITIGSGCHVEDAYIYPTGSETTAIVANSVPGSDASANVSFLSNVYIYINQSEAGPVYAVRFTGSNDFRILSSFIYAKNTSADPAAKAVVFKHEGTGGDLEIFETHAKTSTPNNSNGVLAWNASSTSGSDIIFTGSWSAFNDSSPLAADNDNASGQIKLDIDFENDTSDYALYTTEGNNIVINPKKTGNLAIDLGTGFTSGTGFNMSFPAAASLAGALTGLNIDLSTNLTSGDNAITGLTLNIPNSGSAVSKAIEVTGAPDYGLYLSGETQNYISGKLGIGTTAPAALFDVRAGGNISSPLGVPVVYLGVDKTHTSGWQYGLEADFYSKGGGSANLIGAGFWAYNSTASTGELRGLHQEAQVDASIATAIAGYYKLDINSGTTGTAKAVNAYLDIAAGATVTNLYGFYVDDAITGGTITNSYGMYIEDLTTASTTYGIYQAGTTDKNYFAGNVGVGTTNPSVLLSLGTAGSRAGVLNLAGGTSGTLTLDVPATVTSWTMTLPSADGNANEVMVTDAGGNLSFTTLGAASITADSLDYSEFVDAMTLDASTSVNVYNGSADVDYRVYNSDSLDELLFLDGSSGYVGIGTTLPNVALELGGSGNVRVGGLTASRAVFTDASKNLVSTGASADLLNAVSDETGSGVLVFATSPALVTPSLGVATADSINKVAITAPATGSTLTIAEGKTLATNNSITFAGTDSTVITFQGTDTYVGRTTTDSLTNKTLTDSSNVLGGVTLTLGSDATGDIYYRSAGGVLTRLGVGTANQVLHGGTTPSYSAIGAGDLTADSLDYSEFVDAMTLDATTSVNLYTGSADVDYRVYNSDSLDELLFLDGSSGRLGIGTTNPVQKLHVEGQCVTGDTLLSVVPDSIEAGQEVESGEWEVEEEEIRNIKPGTYVYSLNEKEGKIESREVTALLDMGVKPVFELVTESGKRIRTTANHPYMVNLTRGEAKTRTQLQEIESLAREYGIGREYLSSQYEFSETREIWSHRSSEEGSHINPSEHSGGSGETDTQGISSVPIHSQRKFVRDSGLLGTGSKIEIPEPRSDQPNYSENISDTSYANGANQLLQEESLWLEAIYLKPGDSIVVTSPLSTSHLPPYVVWDKIQSIEYVGEEQVYDIEVEGTQNFIANGILAHNTYISGNVGIGTTTPGAKLSVRGSGGTQGAQIYGNGARSLGWGDSSDVGLLSQSGTTAIIGSVNGDLWFVKDNAVSAPSMVIKTSTGNVGIGTTGPGSKLQVNGRIAISDATDAQLAFAPADGTIVDMMIRYVHADSKLYFR